MEETKSVLLNNGREICLDFADSVFSLSIIFDGNLEYVFPMPYPPSGYAGGSLMLSPSKEYLLFSYYSGQSEEAYMLFKIDDTEKRSSPWNLQTVYESGYTYGVPASYCFSDNERLLVQALPFNCSDWLDYFEQFAQADEDGIRFCAFGSINVLDIGNKTLDCHRIYIYRPDAQKNSDTESMYCPFLSPTMPNDSTLIITMPWGKEVLPLPLSENIFFKP